MRVLAVIVVLGLLAASCADAKPRDKRLLGLNLGASASGSAGLDLGALLGGTLGAVTGLVGDVLNLVNQIVASLVAALAGALDTVAGLTTQSSCPTGWSHHANSCYKFLTAEYNWMNAKTTCEIIHQHGKLVEIESAAENAFVLSFLQGKGATDVWIGAQDMGREGHFVWTTSLTSLNFTHWHDGRPNNYHGHEDCAAIDFNDYHGQWDDRHCEDEHQQFICEVELCTDLMCRLQRAEWQNHLVG